MGRASLALSLLGLAAIWSGSNGQGTSSVWILETDSMPSDLRLVPAVGNGHVATQVYSDTMYVNNLLNGYVDTSHRARIPSTCALELTVEGPWPQTDLYSLDMHKGIFIRTIDSSGFLLEQKIYAHRSRTRLLINEFEIQRRPDSTGQDIVIQISNNRGDDSADMTLTTQDYDPNTFFTSGNINDPETDTSGYPSIYQYWQKVPETVTLLASESSASWSFMTSLSIDQSDALNEFQDALATDVRVLEQEHTKAWSDIWETTDMPVEGNMTIAQTIHACFFHILISTPDQADPINPFSGLSPGGLARGGLINNKTSAYNDYLGHVFWDMDTWILPAILMFQPDKAKTYISARTRVYGAVLQHAANTGYDGVRYPWEQGYTGFDVCPWPPASEYQIHVTADVSYSIRQYLYSTMDTDFLLNHQGKSLVMDIARFWASRSTYNSATDQYDIMGVMGPDENAANVNNSVFTNYNAVLSLTTPQYLMDYLQIQFDASEMSEIATFNEVASKMKIPFDVEGQYHPQYDGFDPQSAVIKQADVVLLGYPLMMSMTPEIRQNDIEVYEQITDPYGPDTGTWSMLTVGWLELGNQTLAETAFFKMFRNINGPFKIFSEKPDLPDNPDGMRCTNFITLSGGLLQSIIFGYGGIRVRPDRVDLNPVILPYSDAWALKGFQYRGSMLGIQIYPDTLLVTLTDTVAGGAPALELVTAVDGARYDLDLLKTVSVPRGAATIYPL